MGHTGKQQNDAGGDVLNTSTDTSPLSISGQVISTDLMMTGQGVSASQTSYGTLPTIQADNSGTGSSTKSTEDEESLLLGGVTPTEDVPQYLDKAAALRIILVLLIGECSYCTGGSCPPSCASIF